MSGFASIRGYVFLYFLAIRNPKNDKNFNNEVYIIILI